MKPPTIALIGNPNTGKSTLFNALCGVRQKVGNYPGVTVEKKVGESSHAGKPFRVADLPGTYSLAPRSPDEMVAVDVLLGRRDGEPPPEAVVCIVDASNLSRNLFLVSQVLELGRPTVVALNMTDVAKARGITIDREELGRRLGVPVVEVQANRKRGVDDLRAAILETADGHANGNGHANGEVASKSPFPQPFRDEVERIRGLSESHGRPLPRYLAERLLLDAGGYVERLVEADAPLRDEVAAARGRLAEAGLPVPAVEAMARYGWVGDVLEGVMAQPEVRPATFTDRVDRLLTHRVGGLVIFAALMFLVFMAIFQWADAPMGWIDGLFGSAQGWLEGVMDDGALRSLLSDGIIGGVGSVVIFLPQIMILFLFIAILEDCGYLARAAYLMDKLMVKIGLSGKSFIPLLSAHACAIPAVMATRVIEDRRDRLATMLVTPLMSCSARIPVYLLLIAAFIPSTAILGGWLPLQPLTMFSMYALGIATAAAAALLFKKTLLKGPTPPFVMELPPYKWPSPTLVIRRVLEEGWLFLKRAGTLIFAVSIVVWALLYFPRDEAAVQAQFQAERAELESAFAQAEGTDAQAEAQGKLDDLDNRVEGEHQRRSFLGQFGRAIEPAVAPLGWDWRIGSAAIASFPAREVVVGVMGVIFNLGEVDPGEEEARERLGSALQAAERPDGKKLFTIPTALSLMVFFALCSQCAATLVTIRRESGSWKWAVFTFIYLTTLAYLGALITYQVGTALSG